MVDPRFNSVHLEAMPRREEFRRAREGLLAACGVHTLALEKEKREDDSHTHHPHTIIELEQSARPAPPPGVKFWLVDKDALYPLKTGLNSVGRMPDNDVVVADASVSRRHCAILVHVGRGCELHDTASKNGTYLNGRRLTGPTRLVSGDEIRMCDRTITFYTDESAPPDDDSPSMAATRGV